MSANSFGRLFCYTTFGESHGPAIGAIVDGCPAGMPLTEADIQHDLDRRRPGTSRFTTQRKEPDTVQILSGVFEGKTTGTPIGLMIVNQDQRSKDYSKIKDTFRPGHADYTYFRKYGIRDYRGGGRSSARETAMRVAAGAIAKKLLLHTGVKVHGALVAMGEEDIEYNNWSWAEVAKNPFFSPDANAVPRFEKLMDEIRKKGDSVGATVEVVAQGVPPGWGEPVIDRLDADLAKAMMSINAVKGVEIGAGMLAARGRGSEMADEMIPDEKAKHGVKFLSNYSGGILGGISSGADIVVRIAVKPTSSIHIPKQTIDKNGNAQEIVTHGRHDPCVGIRAVPVAEAMAAIVLADHFLQNRSRANIFP
ncbi:MAG: chorismate synthase [Magnetococcales bacterium]|nr:chorismate synthase [Magnetococcales bacterium]